MSPNAPTVVSEKPGLPTLWIDTSVLIKLAKIDRGEALQDVEVKRCTRLRTLVSELVRAGKLLCPKSEQEEEYVSERLEEEAHRIFSSLSLGISIIHRQGIFDRHVAQGMKAYARNEPEIRLSRDTYFHDDPVCQLEETRHERFFVTMGPLKHPEMLRRRANAKIEVGARWEDLRRRLVAQGVKYEAQLASERCGYAESTFQMVHNFEANVRKGRFAFWEYMGVMGFYMYEKWWQELRGHPPGRVGVHSFFCSPYFNELPLEFVSCCLNADLVTGNEPIQSGDKMDVELLSVGIPVAHYLLTDRRMELRIKQRQLDTKWETAVFSMATIDGLFAELERLA
jgi:hypothetical protein